MNLNIFFKYFVVERVGLFLDERKNAFGMLYAIIEFKIYSEYFKANFKLLI